MQINTNRLIRIYYRYDRYCTTTNYSIVFIFKYEPAKTLLLPSFDFSVLKISYIRILVHYLFIKYPFQFIRITTRISRCIRRTIVCVKLTYFKPISNIVTYRVRNTYTHFEELIFRGFMLRFFSERFPFWIAAILTSLFFGVAHTYSLGIMVSVLRRANDGFYTGKQIPSFQPYYFIL